MSCICFKIENFSHYNRIYNETIILLIKNVGKMNAKKTTMIEQDNPSTHMKHIPLGIKRLSGQ